MFKRKGCYLRTLQFYETDAMGIIHHANYLRIMEEARVGFLDQIPGQEGQVATSLLKINYPLVHAGVDYKKPLRFGQQVQIDYEAWIEGARLYFDYEFRLKDFENPVAFGKTVHVAFDMDRQTAIRLPKALLDYFHSAG